MKPLEVFFDYATFASPKDMNLASPYYSDMPRIPVVNLISRIYAKSQ